MPALTDDPARGWEMLKNMVKPTPANELAISAEGWKHLEPTQVKRVEDEAWYIETANEHASLWLGDRFAKIAARQLVGIMNRQVRVVMFVGPIEVM